MGIQNLLERPPTLFLVQYHLQDNLPLHHIPIRKRHIHRLYLRRFIYSELSANYISYITVYSYTYKQDVYKRQVYYVRKGDNGYELRKLFSTME